jgi:hypothetical protein
MKKLLGIRTVYNVDPAKTFRIADILEAGAIVPHSVPLNDLLVTDLITCTCLEYAGDSYDCPTHGAVEGSNTSMSAQLNDAGYGSGGVQ